MSAEQVALIPECVECERPRMPADAERWQAYLTDDEPPELAFYCRTARSGSSPTNSGERFPVDWHLPKWKCESCRT